MKTLTLRQPWAHLVAHYGKDVENRAWYTRHRGLMAVHASTMTSQSKAEWDYVRWWLNTTRTLWQVPLPPVDRLDFGAIVAVTRVVGCDRALYSESEWAMPEGEQGNPVYALALADTFALPEPVPCKGRQRLWSLIGDPLEAVLSQLPASMNK